MYTFCDYKNLLKDSRKRAELCHLLSDGWPEGHSRIRTEENDLFNFYVVLTVLAAQCAPESASCHESLKLIEQRLVEIDAEIAGNLDVLKHNPRFRETANAIIALFDPTFAPPRAA